MKPSEKAKAQKIIEKIQAGGFDENDVDNLFMRLRAYSGDFRVFREAADFVAHNDARNQGLVNQSLEAFYLGFKFFLEYGHQQKELDVSKPIPLYIKKLMKYQVDKCKPEQLKKEFNVTPDRLKSRIDNYFKDDKKTKTTQLQQFKVRGQESIAPIQHLLGFIGSLPAFTGDMLIKDLLAVLKHNKLVFDEGAITAQQPTIVICVMLLMHQSSHEFDGNAKGECRIAVEHPNVVKGLGPEDGELAFGELQVTGSVGCIRPDGSPFTVAYPVFQSGLKATDYCDESLFVDQPVAEVPNLIRTEINLDGDLLLLESGKLGPIRMAEVV
jgi:hypothetical protein